jgi:hypothetical protein
MLYDKAKLLKAAEFRRLTGVHKGTFAKIVEVLLAAKARPRRRRQNQTAVDRAAVHSCPASAAAARRAHRHRRAAGEGYVVGAGDCSRRGSPRLMDRLLRCTERVVDIRLHMGLDPDGPRSGKPAEPAVGVDSKVRVAPLPDSRTAKRGSHRPSRGPDLTTSAAARAGKRHRACGQYGNSCGRLKSTAASPILSCYIVGRGARLRGR